MNQSGQGAVQLTDSAKAPLQNVKIYGRSTQDGTPSPDNPVPIVSAGDSGSINITVSDGVEHSQSMSLLTPNGLPGIPVDSGGNYTDASGQQWVCDEIDFARGVYVQRVIIGNAANMTLYEEGETIKRYVGKCFDKIVMGEDTKISICNILNSYSWTNNINSIHYYYAGTGVNLFLPSEYDFESNKSNIIYYAALVTPIETPLSDEEIAAFQSLTAYSPITTVSNDANAWMQVEYISQNEWSPWLFPESEIGLYYKALAGYESDLPTATCRETQLIRKLLDTDYQLDFEVTEHSSRTERYLWDLINGTTSMLSNVPQSDTEKFLHMLLGGEVAESPIIDCERNYWMSRCVESKQENTSIMSESE